MKYSFNGRANIIVEAETTEDNMILLSLKKGELRGENKESPKKRRKYQTYRNCDLCGKEVKGDMGMAQHRRAHQLELSPPLLPAGSDIDQPITSADAYGL